MNHLNVLDKDIEHYYAYCRKYYSDTAVRRIREELERIDKALTSSNADKQPYISKIGRILREDAKNKIIFWMTLRALRKINPSNKNLTQL